MEDGLCPIDSGQKATVMSLEIIGTDLAIRLATTPDLGDDFTVSLVQPSTPAIVPLARSLVGEATPLVILSDAMRGAERRDIRYWIEVTDAAGVSVMDPFPFSILFDCPKGGSCSYYPLAGVSTSGLLVTEDLYAEFSEESSCNLLGILEKLREDKSHADLAPDITTLIAQLLSLGVTPGVGESCSFAWMTVVPIDQGLWEMESSASSSIPEEAVWEFAGGHAGAGLCYTGQARSFGASFGLLETQPRFGHSSLTNVIRCVQEGAACVQPCDGTVVTDFTYNSCVIAEAQGLAAGGQGAASTSLSLSLKVNQQPLLDSNQQVKVAASFPDGKNQFQVIEDSLPPATFSAPMHAAIAAAGFFWAATGKAAGVSPLPPYFPTRRAVAGLKAMSPPETTAFAYTEGLDSFTFEATATSMCTLQSSVYSILQTPAADVAQKSGGIKIKRWADPP